MCSHVVLLPRFCVDSEGVAVDTLYTFTLTKLTRLTALTGLTELTEMTKLTDGRRRSWTGAAHLV